MTPIPKEIYVIDPDVQVDMINPERNIFAIPLAHNFKCIQGREADKVIYVQITKYFRNPIRR